WIAGSRRAVLREAQDLAHVGSQVLGGIELLPLARTQPQRAFAVDGDAMAVVALAGHLRHLAPDHLEAFKPPAAGVVEDELRPRQRRAARIAAAGLGIAEIDDAVRGEFGMRQHVAEAALAAIGDLGSARDLMRGPAGARRAGGSGPRVRRTRG